jgi:predicted esterase
MAERRREGEPADDARPGRLTARPSTSGSAARPAGSVHLRSEAGQEVAVGYVPEPVGERERRLVVALHGAGGSAQDALALLRPVADRYGLLVVAPQSTFSTWDVLLRGFGPDLRRIDGLVGEVMASYPTSGVAVGGFSDGATYALALGLAGGDVFDAVVAFSPGYVVPVKRRGLPRIFVSHGVADTVLPIDRCGRRVVDELTGSGYDVTYEEFAGGHVAPPEIVRRAAAWLDAGWRSGKPEASPST